jgi:hypothetical protein
MFVDDSQKQLLFAQSTEGFEARKMAMCVIRNDIQKVQVCIAPQLVSHLGRQDSYLSVIGHYVEWAFGVCRLTLAEQSGGIVEILLVLFGISQCKPFRGVQKGEIGLGNTKKPLANENDHTASHKDKDKAGWLHLVEIASTTLIEKGILESS